jgi:hypothetical protein
MHNHIRQPTDIPVQRGKDLSDIYAHIVPHLTNMSPEEIRREILMTTISLCQNNTISTRTRNMVIDKTRTLVEKIPDTALSTAVTGFITWLDRLAPADIPPPISSPSYDPRRKPLDILISLRDDYSLRYWSAEHWKARPRGGSRFRAVVGPKHTLLRLVIAETIFLQWTHPMDICIETITEDGTRIEGWIQWIDPWQNRISICPYFVDGKNGGTVYDDVYWLFPGSRPSAGIPVPTNS